MLASLPVSQEGQEGERIMEMRDYKIEVLTHRPSGLLIATSPDLKGFMAHGNDFEELRSRIPAALTALLEARGEPVGEVHFVGADPVGDFEKASFEVHTELVAA